MMSLLLLVLATSTAWAKAPVCDWQGDGKGGKEHQHIIVGYWREVTITLWRSEGGVAPVEIGIRATGALAAPLTAPIEIFLSNGTSLQVTPASPASGRVAVSGTGATTFYDVKTSLDTPSLTALADGGGVSHLHFLLPSGDYELPVPRHRRTELNTAALCVLQSVQK